MGKVEICNSVRSALVIAMVVLTPGCKLSSWYPVMGSVAGGASGSIAGPMGGAAGAGVGYAAGKTAQMMTENEDLKETVDALTHGDVDKLVQKGLESQASGFEEFTNTVKKILTVAGSVLLAYLCIPIILARKTARSCAKSEAERIGLTRAPFPVRPPDEKL
tara:strand:+ start:2094 stop:2579 length:486 start_codon:yes stop_codon:yes gene_type:complete